MWPPPPRGRLNHQSTSPAAKSSFVGLLCLFFHSWRVLFVPVCSSVTLFLCSCRLVNHSFTASLESSCPAPVSILSRGVEDRGCLWALVLQKALLLLLHAEKNVSLITQQISTWKKLVGWRDEEPSLPFFGVSEKNKIGAKWTKRNTTCPPPSFLGQFLLRCSSSQLEAPPIPELRFINVRESFLLFHSSTLIRRRLLCCKPDFFFVSLTSLHPNRTPRPHP